MLEGFRSLLPDGGEVLISEEAADYRLEMEWLVQALNDLGGGPWGTGSAEEFNAENPTSALYRFFELFDWESVPAARALRRRGRGPSRGLPLGCRLPAACDRQRERG